MPIPVVCITCGSRFRVSDTSAGRQGRCPRCGSTIQVPKAEGSNGSAKSPTQHANARPVPGIPFEASGRTKPLADEPAAAVQAVRAADDPAAETPLHFAEWKPEQPQGTVPQKEPLSTPVAILLALGIAFATTFLVCCGISLIGPAVSRRPKPAVAYEPALPKNVTAADWKRASQSQRISFPVDHGKSALNEAIERVKDTTLLDRSDTRLFIHHSDITSALAKPMNQNEPPYNIMVALIAERIPDVTAIQEREKVWRDRQHEREMAELSRAAKQPIHAGEYERIYIGMPETEVESMLHLDGIEKSSSASHKMMSYRDPSGRLVTVYYEKDRQGRWAVGSKAQLGVE